MVLTCEQGHCSKCGPLSIGNILELKIDVWRDPNCLGTVVNHRSQYLFRWNLWMLIPQFLADERFDIHNQPLQPIHVISTLRDSTISHESTNNINTSFISQLTSTQYFQDSISFHDFHYKRRVLVGGFNPLKNKIVTWDSFIPNIRKNKSHVPVTTNQNIIPVLSTIKHD